MIDMKIGDYHITSAPMNYVVTKTTYHDGVKSKAESTIGYYPDLNYALKSIRKHMIMTGDKVIQNFDDYRKANDEIEEMFDKFLEKRTGDEK